MSGQAPVGTTGLPVRELPRSGEDSNFPRKSLDSNESLPKSLTGPAELRAIQASS